jgi:aryl-alcohol dehydrogenase-like predicted oxidoreductase
MAQVALSWVLHKDAVEALDIDLSESDIEFLEEPYELVPVSGHD